MTFEEVNKANAVGLLLDDIGRGLFELRKEVAADPQESFCYVANVELFCSMFKILKDQFISDKIAANENIKAFSKAYVGAIKRFSKQNRGRQTKEPVK